MRRKSYSDDAIIQAVADSLSMAGVIKKLGLVPAGGNYATINRAVKRLGLEIGHFRGQAHNIGNGLRAYG